MRDLGGSGISPRNQWLKNTLLFVPLLTSHTWANPGHVAAAVLAFVAFSLVASSVYLINDMLDIRVDRRHPRKRERPIASGAVPDSKCVNALSGTAPPLFDFT